MNCASKLRTVGQRFKALEPLVLKTREYRRVLEDIDVAKQMMDESEGADRDSKRAEYSSLIARVPVLEEELKVLLLPRDPNDDRNVIIEIRGAEGGEEANLFARNLFDMYQRYSERMGWKMDMLVNDESERGGLNEVSFALKPACRSP